MPQTVNRMVKQYSSGVSVADRDELAIIHKIQVNRTVPSQNQRPEMRQQGLFFAIFVVPVIIVHHSDQHIILHPEHH